MINLILFLIHIASATGSGPIKDIDNRHNFLPSLEPEARKIMGDYGIKGEKFVFLTPYTEDIKVNEDFSVVFPERIKWNGQEFPPKMKFSYWTVERDSLPPMALISPYSKPTRFKYADAICSTLTISKKYVSCSLAEKYSLDGAEILPPSEIAFPMISVSQRPKVAYIWLKSGPKKIYGVEYKNRDILKIDEKKIKIGEDENTANLDWGGKSD